MSHPEETSTSGSAGTSGTGTRPRFTEVLFDLRTVIGGLFAVYGLVCTVWGITSFTDADKQRTGGINLNLWAGLGMLLVGALFLLWSIRRPVVPVEPTDGPAGVKQDSRGRDAGATGR